MGRHFETEIDKLKRKIQHLTAMVEENLHAAVQSVTEGDRALADRVIAADDDVDRMEVEVEEECLKILALYQPVAADLRFVVAVLKINSDLERIGDLAVNIAQRTTQLYLRQSVPPPFDLSNMLTKTTRMVKDAADALVSCDIQKANAVCAADDEIDRLHRQAYRTIEQQVRVQPDDVQYFISLLSVSRNLERIADHATNIAEDVIYMVEGEIIRHRGTAGK